MTADRIEWAAGDSDLDAILEIDRMSFPHPWTREMYQEELRNPERSFLAVCRRDSCPVAGYVSFWLVVDEIHINNVAVRPEFRSQGLGGRLVEFALRIGAGRGASVALLEVRRANRVARRLYERLGFAQISVRARYYSNPVDDALVLQRDVRNLELNPTA